MLWMMTIRSVILWKKDDNKECYVVEDDNKECYVVEDDNKEGYVVNDDNKECYVVSWHGGGPTVVTFFDAILLMLCYILMN